MKMPAAKLKNYRGCLLLQLTVICLWMQNAMPMQEDSDSEEKHMTESIQQQNVFGTNPEITNSEDSMTDFLNLKPNETRTCFPYFISQDIEALLLQASRMLSKSHDERQRSWLELFVRRLQTLSTHLRHLPVKHKNRCFQSKDIEVNSTFLESSPDVQLHNARTLMFDKFATPIRPLHDREYITGKVTDSAEMRPERHYEHALTYKRQYATQPLVRRVQYIARREPSSIIYIPQFISKTETQTEAVLPKGSHEYTTEPIAYKMRESIDYETMPFLPRSSRRTIPRQIEEKMKFHMHRDDAEISTTITTMTAVDDIPKTVEQKLMPKPPKHFGFPKAQAISTISASTVDENIDPSTAPTQILKQTPISIEDISRVGSEFSQNYKKGLRMSQKDDELVQQLHANSHLSNLLNVVHPTIDGIMETTEIVKNPTNIPDVQMNVNTRSDDAILDSSLQKQSKNNEFQVKPPYFSEGNNNGMLPDYEEQGLGAAAGELYEEETISKKDLMVTPQLTKQQNIDQGDLYVGQLQELKSMTSEDSSLPKTAPMPSSRDHLPTDKHK